jgi:hypothetical protein
MFQVIFNKLETRQVNSALITFKNTLSSYQEHVKNLKEEKSKDDLKKYFYEHVSTLKKDSKKWNYFNHLIDSVISEQKVSFD